MTKEELEAFRHAERFRMREQFAEQLVCFVPRGNFVKKNPAEQLLLAIDRWLLLQLDVRDETYGRPRMTIICIGDAWQWLVLNGHVEFVHDESTAWLRTYLRAHREHVATAIYEAPSWLVERITRWLEQPE